MSEKWEAFYHNGKHWVVHTDTALIADCFNSADSERNARLIAAAPDMYETLKDIIAIMSESSGIAGWHLNGEVADWNEFECFQRITELLARTDEKESSDVHQNSRLHQR